MREVTVKKSELLDILKENKKNHRKEFEEALAGYEKKVIEVLQERLEDARNNRKFDIRIHLPQPEDHTSDYERVIEMAKMEVGDTITLQANEFAQFVQDNWGWQEQFKTTSAFYKQ